MARYGTDKPDLRLGLELTELTEYFANTPFRVFQSPYVGAVVMPSAGSQPIGQLAACQVGANPGDCIFFAAGEAKPSRALLGAARVEIGHRVGLIKDGEWSFVWVVDAPLFEPAGETDDVAVGSGAWTAVHHAFTSPKPEWVDSFDSDPANALAYAYDIVCTGNEIGGWSIRIHRKDVQERVFKVMGITQEEAEE